MYNTQYNMTIFFINNLVMVIIIAMEIIILHLLNLIFNHDNYLKIIVMIIFDHF